MHFNIINIQNYPIVNATSQSLIVLQILYKTISNYHFTSRDYVIYAREFIIRKKKSTHNLVTGGIRTFVRGELKKNILK